MRTHLLIILALTISTLAKSDEVVGGYTRIDFSENDMYLDRALKAARASTFTNLKEYSDESVILDHISGKL